MKAFVPRLDRRHRSGVAAVEMALTLPLVLTLLVGTWEVGRIIEVQQFLNVGAREAARQAGSACSPTARSSRSRSTTSATRWAIPRAR